jgi:nicotinate-nucleotide--dimethylbenzimidazole phosphoribosyltransferase
MGTDQLLTALRRRILEKTKPPGSLGRLEVLAERIGLALGTETPALQRPTLLVFAADHGVADHGVSAYPKAVTWQMVMNFLAGGAAINVFCRTNGLQLQVVDAGVDHDLTEQQGIVHRKVAPGTRPFHLGQAMTPEQCEQALTSGAMQVQALIEEGCNAVGFGEMGIGNTSSAALIMHLLTGFPLEQCLGRGTGVDGEAWQRKKRILQQAATLHASAREAHDVLCAVGGFEIAMMAGAMAHAARSRMLVVVDGFISTAAYALAVTMEPTLKDQAVFAHESAEAGHRRWLQHLGVEPLLHMDLRLGEGTGAALVFPLIQCACAMLCQMASFTQAGVDDRA